MNSPSPPGTGSGATGLIDDDFIFRIKKFYQPGTLDFPYYSTVVDGRGYLMLNGFPRAGIATVGLAQVLDDGTYWQLWKTGLPDFPFPYPETVIGLKNAHAWYKKDPHGGGSTVYIFDVKHAQFLSSRQWDAPLAGIVADGEIVCLHFSDPQRTTEICVLNSSQQLVTIKKTELDFELFTEPFDRIASTPGAHLQYTYNTFTAPGAIRVLSRDGFRLTKRLSNMDWRWQYIVQC